MPINILGRDYGLNPISNLRSSAMLLPDIVGGKDVIKGYDPFTSRPSARPAGNTTTQAAKKIQTPNNDSGSTGTDWSTYSAYGGGGGGGGGGSTYNPADLAYLDSQEDRLKGQTRRADTSLAQGLASLLDSYNSTRSDTNRQRGRELENIGVKREDTIRGKDKALDKVNTNARVLADSLRRRLGMASGADSSAYKFAAPTAVAREASGERTDVLGDYGVNFRNLDTTEKRAKEDYDNLLRAIEEDKRSREQKLRQGIESQKIGIAESLAEVARQRALLQGGGYDQVKSAMAPYEKEISSRESAIDGLFNKYRNVGKFNPVKVNMPNLRDYMVDKAGIQANEEAGTEDPYTPYRPQLQDDEENLLI